MKKITLAAVAVLAAAVGGVSVADAASKVTVTPKATWDWYGSPGAVHRHDQCWKDWDATRAYGFWTTCPAPVHPVAVVPRVDWYGSPAPIHRHDQCWKDWDATRAYGFWGTCPAPVHTVPVVARVDWYGSPGPIHRHGECWKDWDATRAYGFWGKCM